MARDREPDRSLVGYSGVICKRRRRAGTGAGVWPALHEVRITRLEGGLEVVQAIIDEEE